MANFEYDGVFIERENNLAGHLKCDGTDTSLRLSHPRAVTFSSPTFEVFGRLASGLKASLVDCIVARSTRYGRDANNDTETEIFPHFIVFGDRWVGLSEKFIHEIEYHPKDIDCLSGFNRDFGIIHPTRDAFRKILDQEEARVQKVSNENDWKFQKDPSSPVGGHPLILYFTGNHQISECDSHSCKIEISNRPSYGPGTSRGVGVKNQVTIKITPCNPLSIEEATKLIARVHSFIELCLGNRQQYREIKFKTSDSVDDFTLLDFHWSHANERSRDTSSRTHPGDVLLDFGDRRSEFFRVLSAWLNTSQTMRSSRGRFASCFFSQTYSTDRIVGAANMFDLLPEDRAPQKRTLDCSTQELTRECRAQFKKLPDSFARQEVLSALGRVGRASLRDKINHRIEILKQATGSKFDDISIPCHQGVICRNHYVHGSDASFDYEDHISSFAFITDTLEFVFAVSDLIELGWDFAGWTKHGTTGSHQFGAYIVNYATDIKRLKSLLN